LECGLGLDAEVTGEVGHHKENVAHLGAHAVGSRTVTGLQLGLDLVHLLPHLRHDIGGFTPVEAHGRRLFGHAKCLEQGRQRPGNTVKHRGIGIVAAFDSLDVLPVPHHLARILDLTIAKDMGVAADHLIRDHLAHGIDVEVLFLACNPRHEDNLQKEVAELLTELVRVAGGDGVYHLVGLLEKVRGEGVERLLAIPGTSPRIAQTIHDFHESIEA